MSTIPKTASELQYTTASIPSTTSTETKVVEVTTMGSTVSLGQTSTIRAQPTTSAKYCEVKEYINHLIATNSVRTMPTDFLNKHDLISRGVDFPDEQSVIIIDIPQGGTVVRNVKLLSSNVAQVEVRFATKSGSEITSLRGAPTSLPADMFPTEKVSKIVIKVTKTSDNYSPHDVTLSIIVCEENSATYSTSTVSTVTQLLTENTPEATSSLSIYDTETTTTTIMFPSKTNDQTTVVGVPHTTPTTTQQIIPTTITNISCEEMELVPILISTNAIITTPEDILNKNDLIHNGVNFTQMEPIFVIDMPKGGVIMRDLKLTSTNVIEIEATIMDVSGNEIGTIRDNPSNSLKAQLPTQLVGQIIIMIKQTIADNPPQSVTLSIIACEKILTTTTMTEGYTQIKQYTTTTSSITTTHSRNESKKSTSIPQKTTKIMTSSRPVTTTTAATKTSQKQVCEHMEYIEKLIASNAVTTQPEDISNKSDFISNGVDFIHKNPRIVIDIPNDGVIIRDIKGLSSNLQEVNVSFTTILGNNVISIRGSPTALPIDEFPIEKVVKIIIELTSTSDNSSPKGVTLSIVACAPGTTTAMTEGTTSVGSKLTEAKIFETTIPVPMPGETKKTSTSTSPKSVATTEHILATLTRSEGTAASTDKTAAQRPTSSESSEETVSVIRTTILSLPQTTMRKYCEHMEYIETLIATDAVTTQPEDISDKSDLIFNGVDFVQNNPVIIIDVPNNGAFIRDIKVPSSNLHEITVSLKTISDEDLTPIRGSPTDLPTDNFPSERVVKIIIELTSTTDNSPPKGVTLSIVGCAPGGTTLVTEATTAPVPKTSETIPTAIIIPVTTPSETETTILSIAAATLSTIGKTTEPTEATEMATITNHTVTTSAATSSESSEQTVSLSSTSTPQMQETTMKKFCEHMEYIETLIASDAVTTSPEDISNKNDLISRGVDFVDKNPRIIINIPKDGAIIR
ncbi:unnamed protein product, partial [Rotaria sp. Silwood2]